VHAAPSANIIRRLEGLNQRIRSISSRKRTSSSLASPIAAC
jgi:hypothetical protein